LFYEKETNKVTNTSIGNVNLLTKSKEIDPDFFSQLEKQDPFHYHHFGSFAYIGDKTAVGEFREKNDKVMTKGFATFLLWRSVYLSKLLSIRNRVFVLFDWTKTFIFGRDISRG